MIKEVQRIQSIQANNAINSALTERIPYFREIKADADPNYVRPSDLYGYIDSIIGTAGEGWYTMQNKSRRDGKTDICFEFRAYSGSPVNLSTGETAPIAGAYWSPGLQCYLSPRFGQAQLMSIYLPENGFVGHFVRYYLEILLSKPDVWQHVTSIHRKIRERGDTDRVIAFWNYKQFVQMYLETVKLVTCGSIVDNDNEQPIK
ncbi:MAG: hypothetical protein J6F33_04945 [Acidaminococcaceae bacterium]|nr:hypothetical protein [Acidaminococcaceae bacterium]